MKKQSLNNLFFLLCSINISIAHTQDYNKDQLIGYWAEYTFFVPDSCSLDSIPFLSEINLTLEEFLSDSLMIELINEEGDSLAWEYEIKLNGTYVGNSSRLCNGKSHQSTGKWDYKNGEFAMKRIDPCSNTNKRDPFTFYYYSIQWISLTAFYECGEEGPGIPVVTIYKKIPDGLIAPH